MISLTSFPLFTINGDSYERGKKYGSNCRTIIQKRIDTLQRLVKDQGYFGYSWAQIVEKAQEFHSYIEAYDSSIIEEMRGIAAGADIAFEIVLFLNVVYEFFSLSIDGVWSGCTTVSMLPTRTEKKNTIIGQNDDWNELFQPFHILLRIEQDVGPNILQFSEAGTIGGNGVNSAGIGLCANSLLSGGWSMNGVPHLVLKRGVLNSSNYADAIRAITAPKRCSSHNYLITHVDGECIDIEAAPHTVDFLFPEDGFLTHTNHFVSKNPQITDYKVKQSPDTVVRKHRADKILSSEKEPSTMDSVKNLLKDHFSRPHSICRHPDEKLPKLNQIQTNASMVIDMSNSVLLISRGPPCLSDYQEIDIWN